MRIRKTVKVTFMVEEVEGSLLSSPVYGNRGRKSAFKFVYNLIQIAHSPDTKR